MRTSEFEEMHSKVWSLKEHMAVEMERLNDQNLEELIQHRQRVYEVGEQCMNLQFLVKKKFSHLDQIHLQVSQQSVDHKQLEEKTTQL